MIAALVLVLTLALTVGGAPPPCCTSKVVGGVEYILRTEEDTAAYGCVNNCIFEKKDEPGPLFCFAVGDLEVICDGEFGEGSGPEGGQGSGSGFGEGSGSDFGEGSGPEGGQGSGSEAGEGSGPVGGEGSGADSGQGSSAESGEGSGAANGEGGGPDNGGEGSGQGSGEGSGEGSGVAGGETGGGNGGGDCSYPADHTMTVYPGPADECGYELKFTGLDDATKKILLDKHNELRQKVASGGEAGQPGAANMRKLVWDEELAPIAQRWTSQCIFEHDKVRDLCDGTVVGQNAYQSGTDYEYYDYNVNPEIGDAVQSWYSEVTNPGFSSANINPFVFDEGYGHYTAVVWADSDRVGCGRVYYEDTDGWFKHLVVCNYAIAANLEGGVMYEEGDKCSNCPAGYSCDATFDGLCAKN